MSEIVFENRVDEPLIERGGNTANYLVLAVALGAAVVAWGVANAFDKKGDQARKEVASLKQQGVMPADAEKTHLEAIEAAEAAREQQARTAEEIAKDTENWHRP
jgi:hypothetical protein